VPDPRYCRLPGTLGLQLCQTHITWVCQTCQTKVTWIYQIWQTCTRVPRSGDNARPMHRAWQPSQTHTPGPDNHSKPKRLGLDRPSRLGLATIWKWQKHPYMQPCFCWDPMIILYLNCFNKRKGRWSPLTHAYFFPSGAWLYFHIFLFEKTNEAPNPKVKMSPEWQINIYIAS